MNKPIIALCALVLGLALIAPDADAARLGGGRNSGMQRQSIAPRQAAPQSPSGVQQAAPAQQPAPLGQPQPAPKRSWLGPIAGLAAGLGLAALFSHFGLAEGMANILMLALVATAAVFVFKLLFRRPTPQPAAEPLHYAGIGGPSMAPIPQAEPVGSMSAAPGGASNAAPSLPAVPPGFDSEGFLRVAKLNFVRLQAANDSGNLDDMREFLAPEMFAEIQLQLQERGGAPQQTDVVQLDAALLEVTTEGNRNIASVRFHGLIREEKNAAPISFDEVWNLVKPVDGSRGWMVAGIQQLA